jgi:CheY-like chemotaxis protein
MAMRTVLVVEDDPITRMLAEATFGEMGYSVLAEETGEGALAAAVASTALDLLFTDIDLGVGVSGWHVAKQVRITHPAVHVIYCSGLAHEDDHSEFGVDRSVLLPKPYEPHELAAALETACGGSNKSIR